MGVGLLGVSMGLLPCFPNYTSIVGGGGGVTEIVCLLSLGKLRKDQQYGADFVLNVSFIGLTRLQQNTAPQEFNDEVYVLFGCQLGKTVSLTETTPI